MKRLARWGALALALACAHPLRAQQACASVAREARGWPVPLDHAVSLRIRDVTLRDALDRISAAGRVRLSYTSELLPLDRRVCVSASGDPVGAVIAALVRPYGAEPTVVAGQVVLAPARPHADTALDVARESVLERMVVTGTPAGAARRPLTVGVGVIDGSDLSHRAVVSVSDALNGGVPGVWLWRSSPSSLLATYGSVRGASSFGPTYPKVYVDGVEVANPRVATEIDGDAVERIEVIRGPQGAALYGSDAISGVINIVTRHGGGETAPAVEVRSEAGFAQSDFATHALPTHRQRIAVRAGDNLRSLDAAASFGGTGGLYPGAGTREIAATAAGRIVGSRSILTGTLRFYDQRAGNGRNPLLAPFVNDSLAAYDQSVRQYTAGASLRASPTGPWSYTLLAGVDGYRLGHVEDDTSPIPSAVQLAYGTADAGGDRASLRGSATARFGDGERAAADLTFAVEHSILHERATALDQRPPQPGERYPMLAEREWAAWRNATGMLVQGNASLGDRLFATGGVRLERNNALTGDDRLSLLPMLGAAYVGALGGAEWKVRAAYGRGIRAPRIPVRARGGPGGLPNDLSPESQAGVEAGAELHLPHVLSMQVTRFDQRATGLIQDVTLAIDTVMHDGHKVAQVIHQLQNVGEITNRGWEMEGTARRGLFALTGTFTTVDSRVRQVATGYGGELRPGDRVLGVPARTAGLIARVDTDEWRASFGASRAWDWLNYDRRRLASDFATGAFQAYGGGGGALRGYWRAYSGQTNVRATAARRVSRSFWISATGDNLLGGQLGEPDNVTIRPGRTLTVSIRTSF